MNAPRTAGDLLERMKPRNPQLGRLVARIQSRALQNGIIAHWNRCRRLPPGFLNLPFFSSNHRGSARRELAA
ncbi:MAG: hypothetical protein IPP68_02785 [Elusimicrobia bacterium]|nr:hypothetical protein [Elusimicrobiota bacterium]